MEEEKREKEELDPVDLAQMEREAQNVRKARRAGPKFNYFMFKVIIFAFIVVAMGMCSVKYIS